MNARQEIHAAAQANGWTVTKDLGFSVEFEREVPAGPKFAAMQQVGMDWTPKNTVHVYFSELLDNGQSFVTTGYFYSFNGQSALTGRYVSRAVMTEGKNRKGQVLSWLTAENEVTP